MSRMLFSIAIAFSVAGGLTACQAEETVKQGIEGELCNNRDDDCRDGHICENGVCRALENTGAITCAEMCARLDECQSGEENCEADCRATIQGTCTELPCPWSAEAIDAFGTCITEELTCEETRQTDAPQECYRRIPITESRESRCEAFIAAADRCNPGVSATALRNRCYLLGRTSTDDSWARTDACVDRVSDGLCDEIEDCYNSVFELSPAIDLGDGSIGGGGDNPVNDGNSPPNTGVTL